MRRRFGLLAPLLVALAILGLARFGGAVVSPAEVGVAHTAHTLGDARDAGTLVGTERTAADRDAVTPARTRTVDGAAARSGAANPGPAWSTVVLLLAALLALVRAAMLRWDAVGAADGRRSERRSGAWVSRAPPAAMLPLPVI